MRSAPMTWVVLAAFALLCACASQQVVPFGPTAQPAGAGLTPLTSTRARLPEFNRCQSKRTQPGWVFRGACGIGRVKRTGKTLHLKSYHGYAVNLTLPPSNATAKSTILIADAQNDGDVVKAHKRAFPTYAISGSTTFLYVKTVNRSKPIRFVKGGTFSFTIAASSQVLGGPCSIARLQHFKRRYLWKTMPVNPYVSGSTAHFDVPYTLVRGIRYGSAYFAFACEDAPPPSPSASPSTSPSASPTSSPTGGPSPTASPSSAPPNQPAYCAAKYAHFPQNGVPFNIIDNSNLGGTLVMYVWSGILSEWLGKNGVFHKSVPEPLPLPCFPGSAGQDGQQFTIPVNHPGLRLYISYSSIAPNPNQQTPPNPLASMPPGGPSQSIQLLPNQPFWDVPWDIVEFGTDNGDVADLSAVTNLGLPMELWQGANAPSKRIREIGRRPISTNVVRPRTRSLAARIGPHAMPAPCPTSGAGTVGVTSCNYGQIYAAMLSVPQYQNLVATAQFNDRIIDLRIMNPSQFYNNYWNFAGDQFYNASDIPQPAPTVCPSSRPNGYLSCVMAAYQTAPRLFTDLESSGANNASTNNYCGTSDGNNFYFVNVGSGTSCAGVTYQSPGAFEMPVSLFEAVQFGGGCRPGFLFGLAPGNANVGSGQLFYDADAFALWKSLALDLNRGSALSTGVHPVGGWKQDIASPVPFRDYYNDPLFNEYAYILHYYYDHNQAYALAYDEPGGQFSGFTYTAGKALFVRINPVPTASSVFPTSPESTPAPPSSCPAVSNVGQ